MSDRLRLIFAGTPDFSASHLQAILEHDQHDVIAIYSQPDRPSGRGKKLKLSPVKQIALDNDIAVFQPNNFKGPEARNALAALKADLMVVVAYGLLLPKAILETPRLGCINVHASLLPLWRGAAPIQRAIEAGDSETGVTIMQMDAGLDTGDMLLKAQCNISPSDTGGSLHDKLIALGQPALIETIDQLAVSVVAAQPQNHSLSHYANKIDKAEMLLNWSLEAELIALKIRAFNPFPVCFTLLGEQRLKIWQASTCQGKQAPAGTITQADKYGIVVSCGSSISISSLRLEIIQLPGGKVLEVAAIMNSKPDLFAVGTQLGQQ